MKQSRQYGLLDWWRLHMALYVVSLHCEVWEGREPTLPVQAGQMYVDVAIPLFFVFSGFFLLRGIGLEETEKVDRKLTANLHGTARMYLFWCVLYLPYAVWGNVTIAHNPLPKLVIKTAWGIFVIGSNYNSWQLWYLLALVVGVWMIRFALRRGMKLEWIIAAGLVLYLLGLYITAVQESGSRFPAVQKAVDLYTAVFYETRKGPFRAVLFVALGILFARRELPPVLPCAVVAVGGFLVALLTQEVFWLRGLALAASVIGVFGAISGVDVPVTKASRTVREMSRYIYLSHMLFYGAIAPLVGTEHDLRLFFIVSAVTVCFSLLAVQYQNRKRRKLS